MPQIKLVVGLGNPGSEYEKTRHNLGQMVFDEIPLQWNKKFKGRVASWRAKDDLVYFLIPETYMNLSGESVQAAASFYKIDPGNILVLHDELDIDFGKLMLKKGGGFAGHNGLKSIGEKLGTDAFLRIRLGIGRPGKGSSMGVADYVLHQFSEDEKALLPDVLKLASMAVMKLIEVGWSKAASQVTKSLLVANKK